MHFLSVYSWCTEKLPKRNFDLMHYVGLVIKLISGPWLLGADWNMEPDMVTSSGWLDLVKGKLVVPSGPTCGHRCYDYFVVARGLGEAIVGTAITSDAGTYPHSPVRLYLKGRLRACQQHVLVHPRKVPALLPFGPLDDLAKHGLQHLSCH